jgi:serine/threonine protein kinase
MELLDGRDLSDLAPVTPPRACELLRDVASALAFLHTHRLVHRDLAPRNVRCTSEGRAKLIDFGVIASPGISGDIAGTPPVISPENVRGLPIDHRADLFGLGALAFFLLTGRHAFPARGLEDLESLWRGGPPPLSSFVPAAPPALVDLVTSLLRLDPLGRPATAAEVIVRLGAVAGLAPVPEVEVTHGYLSSAAMIGRQREVEALRRRLSKAQSCTGGAILIEGPSGRGKSRLLREMGLEAQLAGAMRAARWAGFSISCTTWISSSWPPSKAMSLRKRSSRR